jgi:signal transduction histidine kinase
MRDTIQENSRLSQTLHLTMLLLGLGGPLGGILSGYGIARGLSRSLYRISVRVQDMAQQLERDVAAVHLTPDGDLQRLDLQLQHVVQRVTVVTESLRQQEREMLRAQQLASVGQLAASVAHEVRNPLTSIKMLVEASMRSHRPKPITPESLNVIHGEILRLEQTVQSFLDYARPPALEWQRCDVREVVGHALDLIRARAQQQRVQLEVNVPATPCWADADPRQLCTVLVNLLINAMDAMPRGGMLAVDLTRDTSAALRIAVTDSGTGIEADMLPRLFKPFASTKPTGSGLGLTVCKRIVEEHGGRLEATNRSQGGACFTIALPQAVEVAHADAAGR